MARARRSIENPATARRILAAAEAHFAAEGMAGARTDEIAAAAHANKAMLYYYFGDKRRLHRAVLENLFRQLHSRSARLRKKAAPRAKGSARSSHGYFDFLATHPNYPRLVQREAMEASRNFGWIVRQYLRPFHNQLVRTIRGRDCRRGISPCGSRSHGFEHSGHDHVLFRRRADLERNRGPQPACAPKSVEARKHALLDFLDHGLNCKGAASR